MSAKRLTITELPLQTDPLDMDPAALFDHFRSANTGRIMVSWLIQSLVWHTWRRIQAGLEPKLEGNIRTLWYRAIKPIVSDLPPDTYGAGDTYATLMKTLKTMVIKERRFTYAALDVTDEQWEYRRIGKTHPNIVVFTEKEDLFRPLRDLHKTHDITVVAYSGKPSLVTTEYTARDIREALDANKTPNARLHLIGVVDHDPSGYQIAHAVRKQLIQRGFADPTLDIPLTPAEFTDDEITIHRVRPKKAGLQAWLANDGGIDGKPWALPSIALPDARLRALLTKRIAEALIKDRGR